MFKAWKIFCIMSLLLITMVFAGCGNDGDKFVGSWTGLENPNNPLSDLRNITIEKNGDNFIVNGISGYYSPSYGKSYEWHEYKFNNTAVLKDGVLSFGSVKITYIEKDGTLLYKGGDANFYAKKDDDKKIYQSLKEEAEPFAKKRLEEQKASTERYFNAVKGAGR